MPTGRLATRRLKMDLTLAGNKPTILAAPGRPICEHAITLTDGVGESIGMLRVNLLSENIRQHI